MIREARQTLAVEVRKRQDDEIAAATKTALLFEIAGSMLDEIATLATPAQHAALAPLISWEIAALETVIAKLRLYAVPHAKRQPRDPPQAREFLPVRQHLGKSK